VITEGVTPSLQVDYKRSRIKQYHTEGQALRTETTINDTRDFGVGRLLKNLSELRRIGFAANRRLLEIEQIGHDCALTTPSSICSNPVRSKASAQAGCASVTPMHKPFSMRC